MMDTPLKIIIYLSTAAISFLPVVANKAGPLSSNCESLTIRALLGGSATINCKYPRDAVIHVKSLCKQDKNSTCIDVVSTHTSGRTIRERFSLTDSKDKRLYSVIISSLTQSDAGNYQCAVKPPQDKTTECWPLIYLDVLNVDGIDADVHTCQAGESVYLDCPYPEGHADNEKFLCKGSSPYNCKELVRSTKDDKYFTYNHSFGIKDSPRNKYFQVHIKNVNMTDSGTYWCGSDQTWQHVKNIKIQLVVNKNNERNRISQNIHSRSAEASKDDTSLQQDNPPPPKKGSSLGAIIGGVVGSLSFIAIVVVVFLLLRHKFSGTQAGREEQRSNTGCNTEGNGDNNYEEIQIQNQPARSGDAPTSVYATVSHPADEVHYASVDFQGDSDKNTSTCDFSSGSSTQGGAAAERSLYSTVANNNTN